MVVAVDSKNTLVAAKDEDSDEDATAEETAVDTKVMGYELRGNVFSLEPRHKNNSTGKDETISVVLGCLFLKMGVNASWCDE